MSNYIAAVRHKSYRPGLFDCGTFVAGAITAQTGEDIYGHFEPGQCGFSEFVDLMAERLGLREVPPIQAMRGDPVAAAPAEGYSEDLALGVCIGSHGLFFGADGTLRPGQLAGCTKAWKLGEAAA